METKVDRQGRMPIPAQVRGFLGDEREVVLVGAQDRLELWSKNAWDAFCDNMWPKFGTMATDLARKSQEGSDGSEKGEENNGH
jgi:MraZ protein